MKRLHLTTFGKGCVFHIVAIKELTTWNSYIHLTYLISLLRSQASPRPSPILNDFGIIVLKELFQLMKHFKTIIAQNLWRIIISIYWFVEKTYIKRGRHVDKWYLSSAPVDALRRGLCPDCTLKVPVSDQHAERANPRSLHMIIEPQFAQPIVIACV